MILVRGNRYSLHPNGDTIPCLNCSHNIAEQVSGSTMIYLGKLDGHNFFIYDNPPECPQCHFFMRHHIEGAAIIDVTDEFRKLLDKK